MLTLHLGAVDSRYATDAEIHAAGVSPADLPPGFRLMAHQAHTLAALRDDTTSIVINKARTGDGKSFIAQYLTFMRLRRGLTMYPTNELAADQDRSLRALQAVWSQSKAVSWALLNAPELDRFELDLQSSRSELIDRMLSNSQLILTNPDIFHLLMQFKYRLRGSSGDALIGRMANLFNLFTFDEFHIFNTPQVTSVLTGLILLDEIKGQQKPKTKFLFLSATEQGSLVKLAQVVGLSCQLIDGNYMHGQKEVTPEYRRILQPVTLNIYERNEQGIEGWIEQKYQKILDFYTRFPGSRGLILCNSVASAYRVHELLAEPCRTSGINLGSPNTGLVVSSQRSINAELIIATSTVDVGVDFRINFLVFESLDGATHIQRLGRLGRHITDQTGKVFLAFEAHSILPSWVVQQLKADFPGDQSTVNRDEYSDAIRIAYPQMQDFMHYRWRWGGLQAGLVLTQLRSKELAPIYRAVAPKLFRRYAALYSDSKLTSTSVLSWVKNSRAIFDEATAFRGTSPFTVLVKNRLEVNAPYTSYNLITLLLRGRLQQEPLKKVLEMLGNDAERLNRHKPLGAFQLLGWTPRYRRITVIVHHDLNRQDRWPTENLRTVISATGFSFKLSGDELPDLSELNKELMRRTLVTLLLPGEDPEGLRIKLRLGLQIELFSFLSLDNVQGTIAFGRNALLLDSLIYRQASSQNSNPFFG